MVGLICAVYLFLTYVTTSGVRIPRAEIPTVTAVAAVVLIWVFAPGFLSAGEFELPFRIRQVGLAFGAAGIIARYVGVRGAGGGKSGRILAPLAAPFLGIGLAVGSANWMVAVAAAVMVGSDLIRRVRRR